MELLLLISGGTWRYLAPRAAAERPRGLWAAALPSAPAGPDGSALAQVLMSHHPFACTCFGHEDVSWFPSQSGGAALGSWSFLLYKGPCSSCLPGAGGPGARGCLSWRAGSSGNGRWAQAARFCSLNQALNLLDEFWVKVTVTCSRSYYIKNIYCTWGLILRLGEGYEVLIMSLFPSI